MIIMNQYGFTKLLLWQSNSKSNNNTYLNTRRYLLVRRLIKTIIFQDILFYYESGFTYGLLLEVWVHSHHHTWHPHCRLLYGVLCIHGSSEVRFPPRWPNWITQSLTTLMTVWCYFVPCFSKGFRSLNLITHQPGTNHLLRICPPWYEISFSSFSSSYSSFIPSTTTIKAA